MQLIEAPEPEQEPPNELDVVVVHVIHGSVAVRVAPETSAGPRFATVTV